MEINEIHEKLKAIRDRIRAQGQMLERDEEELKSLIEETLFTAHQQLEGIRNQLQAMTGLKCGSAGPLTEDQKARLALVEKTGTGSNTVH